MNTPLFLFNLALTVGLVIMSLRSGKRGERRAHYIIVSCMAVSLTFAIIQADLYGHEFDFVNWKLQVHLAMATSCLVSLPFVAWTGLRLRKLPSARTLHKRMVGLFLLFLVLTVVTAVYMFVDAVPKIAS